MNKKYLPSALILYLNYFIHGVGCSILGQAVIKEALAAAWGVEAMAITAISAALGLGRLIALPFAGPLSDKLGRRISTAIGSASYAIYLIGLALAFNAGTHGGYTIAYVCAIIGGIANSFLDTGIYPAVSEIIYKAPRSRPERDASTGTVPFSVSISAITAELIHPLARYRVLRCIHLRNFTHHAVLVTFETARHEKAIYNRKDIFLRQTLGNHGICVNIIHGETFHRILIPVSGSRDQ